MKKIALSIVLFFFISFLLRVEAQNISYKKLDEYIEKVRAGFSIPAIAIGIVQNDEILYSKGYGTTKTGNEKAVTPNTIFGIASISKSFTTACLAMLVEDGKIDWHDKVIDYLPDFRMYSSYVTGEITIHDLITHRCGLPVISGGTIWYGSDYSRQDLIYKMRYLKPASGFRSRYAYQNITFVVAAEIIEKVSGKTWDEFVHERIFSPLDMNRSSTSIKELANYENIASPHIEQDGKVKAIPYTGYDNLGPAASITTTVNDMTNYMRMFLDSGKFDDKELIKTANWLELQKPQETVSQPSWFPPEKNDVKPTYRCYGYGWFISDYAGHKTVYHSGGIDGMRSLLFFVPAEKLGIIVLTNQEQRICKDLVYKILDDYFGLKEFDWAAQSLATKNYWENYDREQEQKILQERAENTKPQLAIEKYAGTYFDRMYGDIYITYNNGKLTMQFSHTPAFSAGLQHWHYDTFRINWNYYMLKNGFLTFTYNKNGEITGFNLSQPSMLDVDFSELNIKKVYK